MKELIKRCSKSLVFLVWLITIISMLPVFPLSIEAEATSDQNLNYIDLNNWTNHGNGNWNVEPGGRTVEQTINGNPTFFLSPDEHINTVITGTISVKTTSDDDFIGFVMGYDNTDSYYDFVLFDWKKLLQNYNTFGTDSVAEEGFTLGHFSGDLNSTTYWRIRRILEIFLVS